MTRGYQFTLANVQKYNLWNDLISKDSSFTDPYMGGLGQSGTTPTGFFVPKMCCNVRVRLPFNQTANAGNNLSIIDSMTGEEKNNILTGELHEETTIIDTIDLSKTQFLPSAQGVIVDVQITSY